jgi:hypothetical protein
MIIGIHVNHDYDNHAPGPKKEFWGCNLKTTTCVIHVLDPSRIQNCLDVLVYSDTTTMNSTVANKSFNFVIPFPMFLFENIISHTMCFLLAIPCEAIGFLFIVTHSSPFNK